MNIVITGAGGVIGSYLVSHLLKNTDFHLKLNLRNSDLNFDYPKDRISIIRGDLENSETRIKLLEDCDVCLHLAQSLKPNSKGNLTQIAEMDILPSLALFESIKALQRNIHLIFISSGGTVYKQKKENIPFKEDDECFPLSYYGANKIMLEHYLYLFSLESEINVSVIRAANPYGILINHTKNHGFIGRALSLIKNNQPIEIFGSTSIIRDYIHLQDFSSGLLAVIKFGGRQKYDTLNLGNGIPYSLKDVIAIFEDLLQQKLEIKYLNCSSDPSYNVLNMEKFKSTFNWKPQISLKDGISDMIKRFYEKS